MNLQRSAFILVLIFLGFSQSPTYAQEICDNGIDDDGDGQVDLNDDECACDGISSFLTMSIIPNPSFEDFTCCPSQFTQMSCAMDWQQASEASTDYINQCDFMAQNFLDPPLPFPDGEACIGIVSNLQSSRFQEFVGACLNRPLEQDTAYTLRFNVGFGIETSIDPQLNLNRVFSPDTVEISIYGNPSCDQLPFPGDECPTSYPGSEWEVLQTIEVIGNEEWVEASFNFVPDKTFDAIILGPSCSKGDLGDLEAAYYFLDNLILSESRNFVLSAPLENGSECTGDLELRSSTIMSDVDYQWYRDGIAIPGATDPTLFLGGGNIGGDYQVRLSQGADDCEISEITHVESLEPIEEEIRGDTTFCEGSSTVLFVPDQYQIYEWSTASSDSSTEVTESGTYFLTITDENGCSAILEQDVIKSPTINIDATVENARGTNDNGHIQTNLNGGISPYQYRWNTGENTDSIAGLSEGWYYLTVEDDFGCIQTDSFFVEFIPNPLDATIQVDNLNCHNDSSGRIELNIQGGYSPYKVDWNTGDTATTIDELPSGDYSVTITDDSGDRRIIRTVVEEPDPLGYNIEITPPSCHGLSDGRIHLSVNGGSPGSGYNIFWDGEEISQGPLQNVAAGEHTLEISDANQCAISEQIEISQPRSLLADIDFQAPNCFGSKNGSLDIFAIQGGTRPYRIELNGSEIEAHGATNLEAGHYSLEIFDSKGCLWSSDFELEEPAPLEIELDANPMEVVQSEKVTLTADVLQGTVDDMNYQWQSNAYEDLQWECLNCFQTSVRPKRSTNFTFTVWDEFCKYTSDITVEVKELKVYRPNIFTPNGDGNNDYFIPQSNHTSELFVEEFIIYDRWGTIVHQTVRQPLHDIKGWDGKKNGRDLQEGVYVYFLKIRDERGEIHTYGGDITLLR